MGKFDQFKNTANTPIPQSTPTPTPSADLSNNKFGAFVNPDYKPVSAPIQTINLPNNKFGAFANPDFGKPAPITPVPAPINLFGDFQKESTLPMTKPAKLPMKSLEPSPIAPTELKPMPEQSTFQKMVDLVGGLFKASPEETRGRALDAYATYKLVNDKGYLDFAKQVGIDKQVEDTLPKIVSPEAKDEAIINYVRKNIDTLTQIYGIPKESVDLNYVAEHTNQVKDAFGIERAPTNLEMAGKLMTIPVVAGLIEAPLAVGLSIAGYEILSRLETKVLQIVTGNKDLQNISEALPSGASQTTKDVVDILDFLGKGLVLGGIYKKAPALADTFTKNIITEYKLPENVYIDGAKIKSIFQTGEKISPEEEALVRSLGLDAKGYKNAVQNGLSIEVPASKIVTVADRPFWAKIKEAVGLQPMSDSVVDYAGKVKQAPVALLGEGKPVEPVAPSTTLTPIPTPKVEAPVTPEVKPIEPLVAEAKKFKTAEEFVNSRLQDTKLVDKATGNPLTVYTGQVGDFGINKPFKISKGDMDNMFGEGIYFSPEKRVAEQYALGGNRKGRIYEVNLDIKNPLTPKNPRWENFIKSTANAEDKTNWLKRNGYDGVVDIGKGKHIKQIMVLDNSQVVHKSELADIWNKAHKTEPTKGVAKFNNVEEFINAQTPIYHGTTEKFNKFSDKKGVGGTAWFSDNKKAVEENLVEATKPAGAKWNIMERYINPEIKLVDRNTIEGRKLDDNMMKGQLRDMGYGGVKHEADSTRGSYIELFNPSKDAWTKSQLIDFYNKIKKEIAQKINDKFYTLNQREQGLKFEEVKGKPVAIMPGIDTFVYKNDAGMFVVTEAKSGKAIGNSSQTQKGAIENARKLLEEKGKEQVLKAIEIATKEHGLSPRFTQKERVIEAVKTQPKSIKQIAQETKILEPNVRRILGVGAKTGTFERVAEGVYKLSKDGQEVAVIHTGDAIDILPKLAADGMKADMIFLDIPYETPAVKGGNRGVRYNLITPDQFKIAVDAVKQIARKEDTPVFYMYSQAASGLKAMQKYTDVLLEAGFKPVAKGEWQKLFKTGAPVTNVRGEVAKPEGILLLTQSGKFENNVGSLDFKLVRPKGYQTEKPAEMIEKMVRMSTKVGDTVLDPFAGSGVVPAEAIKAGRKAVAIEKNATVVEERIKPRIEEAVGKQKVPIKTETPAEIAPTKIEPVAGGGELKTRGLAKGVEANAIEKKLTQGFGDLPEYRTVNMEDQANRAADLINSDYERAVRIAMGEEDPPKGLLPESVFVAIEEHALKLGDVNVLRELATQSKLTGEATTMGQRIRTLGERDPNSAIGAIADVLKAREKAVKARGKDLVKEKAKISEEIKKEIKKSYPKKETWEDFINSIKC